MHSGLVLVMTHCTVKGPRGLFFVPRCVIVMLATVKTCQRKHVVQTYEYMNIVNDTRQRKIARV